MENLKAALTKCRSDKQAREAIRRAGYSIIRDDTADIGSFSVWLDDTTRIYKSRKEYILQKWQAVEFKYSGIPVFFGAGLFDKLET